LEFTHFFVVVLTFLDSIHCVTKGKWKNGKARSFLGVLPLFPQFYTFLSGRIFLSSREFPVEIIFLGLFAVALSISLFPVFLSYERLPVFLVGILGKALRKHVFGWEIATRSSKEEALPEIPGGLAIIF
jgi:hypothetical protein